jgi:DNA polymerase-3 subunit delta
MDCPAMDSSPAKPVYVLYGGDAFTLDARRREITALVAGGADPQLCVASFEPPCELADVLDELRTVPFLAPRRLVIVRQADEFVSAHREALEKFLETPPSSATLMLVVSSWPSNTRLARLVQKIGQAIECAAPAAGNLAQWVATAAGKRGKKIAPDAAALMVEWVGGDLAALDGEIEKLSLYVAAAATISLEDVCALVTASAGPAAFALTNAVTDGDPAAALKALAGMLRARGDEFKTLGMIGWHLRRAMLAKENLDAGQPPRQAVPRMPPQQADAFLAMLNRRPLSAFHNDFRRLIRADLAMKSGTDPAAALQELVVALCS